MDKKIIALAGNPNSGKTTLFNSLTGSKQHVGNWPGKTVEKFSGGIKIDGEKVNIIDLPGTYSLTSFSPEERVTRDFIINEKPDVVINIIDATNVLRNLFLTLELIEMGANVVIGVNLNKLARKKGIFVDLKKMSDIFKVPVYDVNASDKKEAKDLIIRSMRKKKSKNRLRIKYNQEIEEHIDELKDSISKEITALKNYDNRWLAVKLLENDEEVIEKITSLDTKGKVISLLKEIRDHLKSIFKEDFDTIIMDKRKGFAVGAVKQCLTLDNKDRISRSDLIDKVVINKYLGIPIFLIMIFLLFQATFSVASPLVDFLSFFISGFGSYANSFLETLNAPSWLISLSVDGIIEGVGSIIIFLPNILIMFFFMSLLEDSGYFARGAYVMDNLMHKIGLHGKSFIPMILGFGCNVPAILSTRMLERKKDRIITILINPFMSCSARLPVYLLFVSAFFSDNKGLVIFSLYLLGLLLSIFSGLLLNKIFFKSQKTEIIMELPPYRIPTLRGAFIHAWERSKHFLRKAGTVIFVAVVIVWLLSSLPLGVEHASKESILGKIGVAVSPVLEPLGFGNWQSAVALITGTVAKEIVISTFGTLYDVGEDGLIGTIKEVFTPLSAYSFMVVTLLYIPCIATIAVIKKETGSWKWAALSLGYSMVIAWLVAFMIYQGGLLLGFN